MVLQPFELASVAIKSATDGGFHALGCVRRQK